MDILLHWKSVEKETNLATNGWVQDGVVTVVVRLVSGQVGSPLRLE
jgi:hypothetical protein